MTSGTWATPTDVTTTENEGTDSVDDEYRTVYLSGGRASEYVTPPLGNSRCATS